MPNTEAWKKQLDLQAKLVIEKAQQIVNKAAESLFRRVVDYTPVGNPTLWKYPAHRDYVPGFLKSNWKLAVDNKEIIISNDAPYALRVEYGWSSQAPKGMLRRAIMDFPQILQQITKETK